VHTLLFYVYISAFLYYWWYLNISRIQDEGLFGKPSRLQQMTGNRGWTGPTGFTAGMIRFNMHINITLSRCVVLDPKMFIFSTGKKTTKQNETIKVITSDLVREIR